MTVKSTGWTPEKRARAAQKARETKPWKNSTGPRTDEGKETAALNAMKCGLYSKDIKDLKRLLRAQKEILKTLSKET